MSVHHFYLKYVARLATPGRESAAVAYKTNTIYERAPGFGLWIASQLYVV